MIDPEVWVPFDRQEPLKSATLVDIGSLGITGRYVWRHAKALSIYQNWSVRLVSSQTEWTTVNGWLYTIALNSFKRADTISRMCFFGQWKVHMHMLPLPLMLPKNTTARELISHQFLKRNRMTSLLC